MSFKNLVHSLRGDRVGDDGIDVLCGLDSIGNLPSGGLCNGSAFRGGRELGGTTRMRLLMVGK